VLYYVLICLCLVLTGIAGLQLAYMFYLDRLDKDRKRRLRQLERRARSLELRLDEAHAKLEAQDAMLEAAYGPQEDEVWADVIDDN
jgi:hypothetical protein